MQLADDVFQVQLPLPFALRIVNCYLLRDNEGWTIVDCGLNWAESQSTWQATFAELGITPRMISQIVLTHFHPDHFGMAGWLQQWCGPNTPVRMAPREDQLAKQVWGRSNNQSEPMLALFTAHGAPNDQSAAMIQALQHLRTMTQPHPQVTLLEPGSTLRMGQRDFQVIHAPGHSDGQLIFYDPANQLMLCGDQVLRKITPHIGTWPESEANPLGRYLASLRELRGYPVRLALPGHGPLISDWVERLDELAHHHQQRLTQMLALAQPGATAYAVASQVFDVARLTPHEMRFAVAETISHLDLLVQQGQLHRSFDTVWVYHA